MFCGLLQFERGNFSKFEGNNIELKKHNEVGKRAWKFYIKMLTVAHIYWKKERLN